MKFKHFPTGLLRCGISKRKAKLFVTALMVAATAQTCFAQNAIEGVQDLVGKTIIDLEKGVTKVEVYSHDDLTKIFFLYNVKTGQFFNAGGYWGTEGTMRDYPLKLWAKDPTESGKNSIRFAMELKTNQGQYIKWAGGNNALDNGVFIDRYLSNDTEKYSYNDWFLTPTDDGKNTYKIYTYKATTYSTTSTKYYMCVCGDIVDVQTEDDINNSYAGYDEWRIFSMDQIVALQQANLDALKNSLELSFKLKCAGFSRGDNELNSWKMYPWGLGTDAIARFGLEHLYDHPQDMTANPTKPITLDRKTEFHVDELSSTNTYSFKYNNTKTTTDKTFSEKDEYQRYLGKYFCADVKNVRGIIYQDVEIKNNGVYVVECKGYSNTEKAKLFATIVTMGDNGKWTYTGDGQIRSTVLSQVSNMSAAEQEALHTDEKNMDYAGQEFYNSRKYINNVLVNVEDVDKTRKAIRFGIMVGSQDDATPVDGEWTVFDDFRLLFANKVATEDLVLDEDRDDLEYLKHETTYRNRTLHLNKTLVKDKWNSLVLPVDLTIDQFRNAFGANARLAELTKLAANEIMFESDKTLDDLVTTTDKNTVVLEAYKPYIIFPTKDLNNETNHMYTAKLRKSTNGGDGADNFENVTIKANHIQIPNVTMKYIWDGSVFKNDLTNMNTNNWTSTLNTGDGTITAYGTFARTFGEAEQNEKGEWVYKKKDNILANRDNLIGSYFFYEGNMYYSNERARGLRGFSCWFKPKTDKKATLFLDGVQQEGGLTDIGEITFEPQNESMKRFANGIYNMNGQLVKAGTSMAGMPKGIYIVNGKKVVVR